MNFLVTLLVLALAVATALGANPGPLQDTCVGINTKEEAVFINGKFCKDPNLSDTDDFVFTGLRTPGNTGNQLGSKVTPAFVDEFPGINTLGVSSARIDFALGGLNLPHYHPRASEILFVLEGTLFAGLITSDQLGNRLFTNVLYPGDFVVFPVGLVHFQLNVGKTNAVALASFGSQNPGVITIANEVFGAHPPVNVNVLRKAFQLGADSVKHIQSQFWSTD